MSICAETVTYQLAAETVPPLDSSTSFIVTRDIDMEIMSARLSIRL